MDASAFVCALRRFFALRGPAAILRCDNGSNFVGGKSELDDALKEMDQSKVQRFISEHGKITANTRAASNINGRSGSHRQRAPDSRPTI
ncbi:hypothetical protein QZH41_004898 [Actinostola sp. cb2023]|nr:hypothetical protein QZH41_004898 [Actinostola sp. cb2023]